MKRIWLLILRGEDFTSSESRKHWPSFVMCHKEQSLNYTCFLPREVPACPLTWKELLITDENQAKCLVLVHSQQISKTGLFQWLKRNSTISLLCNLNRQHRNISLWSHLVFQHTESRLTCMFEKPSHAAFTDINCQKIRWLARGFNIVLHQLLHKSYSCYILLLHISTSEESKN